MKSSAARVSLLTLIAETNELHSKSANSEVSVSEKYLYFSMTEPINLASEACKSNGGESLNALALLVLARYAG